MIGLCLSMYFQGETSVRSMHLDQYKNLQYNEERSHSLSDFDQKILPVRLEDQIQEILDRNRLMGEKTRVMEIGAGNGRVLMELKKLFPEVEFYGINKEKTHTFYRRESFILTALKFGIFNKNEIDGIDLPYVVFQDLDFGNKIPYEDKKFDIIYTQNTIKYIKYKFELFNEIMRVLRPGGFSLHTDMPIINVYNRGVLLDYRDMIAMLRRRGIDISPLENEYSIRFRKKEDLQLFPLTPHQTLPETTDNISAELRRPDMGYNLNN